VDTVGILAAPATAQSGGKFVSETMRRVRQAEASGPLLLRADAASTTMQVQACGRAGGVYPSGSGSPRGHPVVKRCRRVGLRRTPEWRDRDPEATGRYARRHWHHRLDEARQCGSCPPS